MEKVAYSLTPRPMEESTMDRLGEIFNLEVSSFLDVEKTTEMGNSGMAFHFDELLEEQQISDVSELGYTIEKI